MKKYFMTFVSFILSCVVIGPIKAAEAVRPQVRMEIRLDCKSLLSKKEKAIGVAIYESGFTKISNLPNLVLKPYRDEHSVDFLFGINPENGKLQIASFLNAPMVGNSLQEALVKFFVAKGLLPKPYHPNGLIAGEFGGFGFGAIGVESRITLGRAHHEVFTDLVTQTARSKDEAYAPSDSYYRSEDYIRNSWVMAAEFDFKVESSELMGLSTEFAHYLAEHVQNKLDVVESESENVIAKMRNGLGGRKPYFALAEKAGFEVSEIEEEVRAIEQRFLIELNKTRHKVANRTYIQLSRKDLMTQLIWGQGKDLVQILRNDWGQSTNTHENRKQWSLYYLAFHQFLTDHSVYYTGRHAEGLIFGVGESENILRVYGYSLDYDSSHQLIESRMADNYSPIPRYTWGRGRILETRRSEDGIAYPLEFVAELNVSQN